MTANIPSYDHFIEPLLRFLALHPDGVDTGQAHEAVADALGLSTEQRGERVPSGVQPVYKNRSGWAHDRLKRAGLSTCPRYGNWQITAQGVSLIKKHPSGLPQQEIDRIALAYKGSKLSSTKGAPEETVEAPKDPSKQSPEERIDLSLVELHERVSRDLLELIGQAPPSFFENLVLDLLHAMGYGTSRRDLQRVGGSGDGGIDGIISLDRLGLEKVYIQAKRWKNTVGRPEIQGFYGALAGRRANKGVFITTSAFTKEALEFATQVEKIVLVDGARLTALMIEHGVGVTHKLIKVAKVDSDYFEEG